MTSLIFPDLNVWLALTLRTHTHHASAWGWYKALDSATELVFCRTTQIGFLRLLTTESVARSETLNQVHAWRIYDRWIADGGAIFLAEPAGVEIGFRSLTARHTPAKEWTDSYLAAFAAAHRIPLVTFDHGLHKRAHGSIFLA